MEVLAVVAAIASIAQLIEIVGKIGSALNRLARKIQHVPEELRRQQIALRSIQTKLLLLQSIFTALQDDTELPPNLLQEFQLNLEELQKDIEAVVKSIKPYDSGKRRVSSVRERVRFSVWDHRALTNATKHLVDSERNLQRIETTVHLYLTNDIYRQMNLKSAKVRQSVTILHGPYTTVISQRSRKSFLNPASAFRQAGLYSWLTKEERVASASYTVFCLGACFSFWLVLVSVSLECALTNSSHQDGWSLQWNIRIQHRVQTDAPLMMACRSGDVPLIQQILKEGRGSLNDRTICSGKTALLVAIQSNHFAAVEFLLQNGADPNMSDDDQVTPLFAAAGMDPSEDHHFEQLPPTWDLWLDVFRLLVQYRACTHETVRGRHIAGLNIVREDRPPKTLAYLGILAAEDVLRMDVIAGHQCWSALQNALRSGSDAVDALSLLYSAGVNLSKVMDDGRTSLHLAAEWCANDKPLEYLCSIGCKEHINKQDRWGWTPLHYATISRNSAVSSQPFSKVVSLARNGGNMYLRGEWNPLNHYDQPHGEFTPGELLSFARPSRFDMLRDVLRASNIDIDQRRDESTVHNPQGLTS